MVTLTPLVVQIFIQVRVVRGDRGVKRFLAVLVLAGDLSAVYGHFADFALVGFILQICEADGGIVRAAGGAGDDLPERNEAADHEHPDQNRFYCAVQRCYPFFPESLGCDSTLDAEHLRLGAHIFRRGEFDSVARVLPVVSRLPSILLRLSATRREANRNKITRLTQIGRSASWRAVRGRSPRPQRWA